MLRGVPRHYSSIALILLSSKRIEESVFITCSLYQFSKRMGDRSASCHIQVVTVWDSFVQHFCPLGQEAPDTRFVPRCSCVAKDMAKPVPRRQQCLNE